MSTKLTEAQRDAVVRGLRTGVSVRQVARDTGFCPATVSGIAHAAGIKTNVQATKIASSARREYALAERLELLNRFFDKTAEMLDKCASPHELQQLTIAVGTLIDKRRLEDGEATSRQEINQSAVRDQAVDRLADLVGRRRAS